MNKYDNYVQLMNKINKVRTFTIKHKVPLLAALIVSSAALVGFLSTKGMITSTSQIPSSICYGEEYKLNNAKVLFGKASYEYREKNSSSWSKELPTTPGEYYVRAVSNRTFGVKSYSEEKLVEIKPINVSLDIENTTLVYGDIPQFDTSFLVRNDRIEKVNVSFENPQEEETNVEIDSLVIVNEDGKDISSFYSFECESKKVSLTPRIVDFIPFIESKVYDGEKIVYEEGKLTNEIQLYDDIVSFDVYYTDSNGKVLSEAPKNASNNKYYINVDLDSFSATNNGVNVNNKYKINKSRADFSISQREIKIETNSKSKIYDGKSFVDTSDSLNLAYISSSSLYNLVEGDEIVINSDFNYQKSVNAGNYLNSLSVSIINQNKEDTTSNYKISYDFGELEISKKEINGNLIPSINSFEYNGEMIDSETFVYTNLDSIESSCLVEGQKLVVKLSFIDLASELYVSKPKNAGKYKATIGSYYVTDENGNIHSDNYINNLNGFEFEITPRKVKIQPFVIENFDYDGDSYTYDNNNFTNFSVVSSSIIEGDNFTIRCLFTNLDRNDIPTGYTYSSAGHYEYSIDIEQIVPHGLTKLSNYDFDLGDNKYNFTINKRDNDIKLSDFGNFEYSGLPYQYNSSLFKHDFVEGESASLVLKYYDNTHNTYLENFPINAGSYRVEVIGLNYNENTDSRNYNINLENAYKDFVITPRYLNISLNSFNVTYGEKVEFNKKGYEITKGAFVNNESVELSISIDEKATKLDVGKYQLNCVDIKYINSLNTYDDELAQNYVISIDNSNSFLEVTTRNIVIQPKVIDEFVYDGVEYSYADLVSNEFGNFDYASSSTLQMVENENVKIEVSFYDYNNATTVDRMRNAGRYDAIINSISGDENTKIDNYSISFVSTSLEIKPRSINISPIAVEDKYYDSDLISFGEYDYLIKIENPGDLTLVEGDDLKVEILIYDENSNNYLSEVRNAGSYHAEITSYLVNDNVMENGNYFLSPGSSRFTIKKRPVTLKYNDDQKVYDGEDYVFDKTNYTILDGNFVEFEGGVYLSVSTYYLVSDRQVTFDSIVKAEKYSLDVYAYSGINGVDLNNYEISYDTSTVIEIKKRTVTLETLTISDFEYDGQNHYYPSYYGNYNVISETTMVGGEAFILSVNFLYESSVLESALNAGYYEMEIATLDDRTINGINGFLLSNYDFTFKVGTFNVNKRHVEVKVEDITKVYDGITYNHTYNVETINSTSFPNDEGIIIQTVLFNADPLDVGVYTIEIKSFKFKDNTLAKNYYIDYSSLGELEITKRSVTIAPMNFEDKEYDGGYYQYSLYSGNYIVTSTTSLVEGEEFIVGAYFVSTIYGTTYDKVKDADTYSLNIKESSIKPGNSKTKVSNYEINVNETLFTISPLYLEIYPDLSLIQGTSYYDGNVKEYTIQVNNFIITNNKEIPEGEGFSATLGIIKDDKTSSLLHAGTYSVYVNFADCSLYNDTKMDNYTLNSCFSSYTIDARQIIIELLSMDDTIYDGKGHSYVNGKENNFIMTKGSMVGDEVLSIYCTVGDEEEVYDVGIYAVRYIDHTVTNGLASDYKVTPNLVRTYQIVKRNVAISLYQIDDFTYTGYTVEPYKLNEANQFDYEEGSLELAEGEFIYFKKISYFYYDTNSNAYPFHAGSYSYTAEFSDEYITLSGRSLNNYKITFDTKFFKINKADLNVKLYEDDIVHTYNNQEVTDIYGFTSNILGKDTISISVKVLNDDGEEEAPINAKTYYIYIDEVDVNVASNYNIIISDDYRRIIINPCDVYVNAENKEYTYNGEAIDLLTKEVNISLYKNSVLYNGDEIIVVSYVYYSDEARTTIISNPKDADTYYYAIEKVTINHIENITNYNFIIDENVFKLTINPREVTIYPLQMATITYDGEYHSYPSYMGNYDYAVGALDGVEFDISIVFRHYGKKNNNSKGVIEDEMEDVRDTKVYRAYHYLYDGIVVNDCNGDLISNYSFELGSDANIHKNTFTIKQISLIIYTSNSTIEYDGEYHLFDQDIIYVGTLLAGHNVKIIQSVDQQNYMFKDVGIYSNNFPVDIIDENNIDDEKRKFVTENYDITYIFGEVEITKKTLEVTSLDMNKNYDGKLDEGIVLSIDSQYTLSGLITTDTISVKTDYAAHQINESDYIEAGEYINYVKVETITDKYGNDVTNNYSISYTYGKYTISIVDLEFKFKDLNLTFNNQEVDYTFDNNEIFELLSGTTLQNNDKLQGTFTYYLEGQEVSEIKKAGTYTIVISDIKIIDGATNEDRTSSYDITYPSLEAEVVIDKIDVEIETSSNVWVYDEDSHYDNSARFVGVSDVDFECEIICVGDYESVIDVGEEKINKFDIAIMSGDEDITSSFNILSIIYGVIKIGDKITITDKLNSFPYDGNVHAETQFSINCRVNSLHAPKLTCIIDVEFKDNILPYEAGEYYCRIISYTIIYEDKNGNKIDQTAKYKFEDFTSSANTNYELFKVDVTKKKVYIGLKSVMKSKVYDGEILPFASDEWSYILDKNGKIRGDTFALTDTISISAGIVDSYGVLQECTSNTGSKNYQISDYTIIGYNGIELTLNPDSNGELKDKYLSYTIILRKEDDTEYDRNVHRYTCRGTISKRAINVKTYGNTEPIVYDGQFHYVNKWEMEENGVGEGLINDHTISLIENGFGVARVGSYLNRLRFKIVDGLGNDMSANYRINYNSWTGGNITIDYRKLTIKTGSKTITESQLINEYGGVLVCYDYEIVEGELVDGEVLFSEELYNLFTEDEKYKYRNSIVRFIDGSLDVVGSTQNTVITSQLAPYLLGEDGRLTSKRSRNYEFTIIYGTLTVVEDSVTI